MLKIYDVSKFYRGQLRTTDALTGVSLELPRGEIVGIFGENGAGKTTLLKCILGYLNYQGQITLDGQPITRKNIEKISFATCEHSFFPGLTAKGHREFYKMHFEGFREKRFDALMEFFDLPDHKPLRAFSTGQKNQFEVIQALCQGADYILMDEPFAGNDLFNREDFYKVLLGLLEPQETVLIATHLIEEVEHLISRAVLIRRGKVVGDVQTEDLEEEGRTLVDYVKETYHYRRDRVSSALEKLTGQEER